MSAKAVVPVRTSSTVASAPLLQGLNLFLCIRAVSLQEWNGWLLHAFYQSALGTRLLCLCLSKCLATVGSATVFCKRTVSNIANALPLHTHPVVLIVPRFLIKRLLLEMPERAKTVCICMHAHTNCILFWQASYQSLLGGVIVNASNFHEQAGYTLASAFHLLKLIFDAA